jgi:hypothetical protein
MKKRRIYNDNGDELIVAGIDAREAVKSGKWSYVAPKASPKVSQPVVEQKKVVAKPIDLTPSMPAMDPKAAASSSQVGRPKNKK